MWGRVAFAAVLVASSCSSSPSPTEALRTKAGPGFAVEGSLATDFTVHLYRVQLGPDGRVEIGFHPNDTVVRFDVLRPERFAPAGGVEVCPFDPDADCVPFVDGKAEVDFRNESSMHVNVALVARRDGAALIDEMTMQYRSADNFLAVHFPG